MLPGLPMGRAGKCGVGFPTHLALAQACSCPTAHHTRLKTCDRQLSEGRFRRYVSGTRSGSPIILPRNRLSFVIRLTLTKQSLSRIGLSSILDFDVWRVWRWARDACAAFNTDSALALSYAVADFARDRTGAGYVRARAARVAASRTRP